jgi:hypothetical protein
MQGTGMFLCMQPDIYPGSHYVLVLGFLLFLMNVIIFIIRVLKLLFMNGKYFFLGFIVILAGISPAAGSLTKIIADAPVYIGEQNLDISSGLQGCHVIDWWANGTDMTAPPQKNVTIIQTLEDSEIAHRYSIDPKIYSGYTGTWYCEDKKPPRAVFEVLQPQLSISIWDLDKNEDITGKTVPLNTNITYHIDTNLDRALQYKYRPDINPRDSFFTVTLTDSRGNGLPSLYSGSYGKADAKIIAFESTPYISASPYIWKDGRAWDHTSRNAQGDFLYPAGTYTFTVKQNLNRMAEMYESSTSENRIGLLEASATVTFTKPESLSAQTITNTVAAPSGTMTASPAATPVTNLTYTTLSPTRTTIPAKTTYAPLPLWIVLSGLGIAFTCATRQKR